MAFPDKTKGFFYSAPRGWDDLGSVKGITKVIDDKVLTSTDCHTFCKTVLHVGREDGSLFYFCPMCIIKIKS